MWLPQSVMYPDGSFGPRPSDGRSFFVGDEHYIWDDATEKWVNKYGEHWHYTGSSSHQSHETGYKPTKSNGCECGAWVGGKHVRHSRWCPKYTNPEYIDNVPFDEWKKDK